MRRSLSLVFLLMAVACASVQPPAEPVHVVIVGTTDVHGWFNGHIEAPAEGGKGVLWGGLPALASYVERLRELHEGRVIVVDSGDMFQGTLESNLFEGEAVVRGYNVIGYAAAAIGNHEFDFGPVGPAAIARAPNEDPLGALKRNAELAKFPLLSANLVEKSSGKWPSWAKRYTIVRAGAARIGIIGLSTPDTPNVTMAANVTSLQFTDPVSATIATAKQLRGLGVDAILVIAHMGGRCAQADDPHSLESCAPDQEANAFLEALPPGTIDGYFAGHTHSQMRHVINGVPAMQSGPFSQAFATLDLWIDTREKRVARSEMRPHTMICSFVYEGTESCNPKNAPPDAKLVPRVYEGETIVPDARVVRVIEPFLRRVASKREEKVGIRTAAPFPRAYVGEASLGNLLADALREFAESDLAVMNSGAIRADLPAGELTYADVFAVSPFDNFPSVVTMTGAQIEEMLRLMSSGPRGILQVSGLRYTIDAARDEDKPPPERHRVVDVSLAGGAPLDPEHLYTVAMPDFIAAGGDGTQPVMDEIPRDRIRTSYLQPIRDVVIEVLRRHPQPLVPAIEGRITVLNRPQ